MASSKMLGSQNLIRLSNGWHSVEEYISLKRSATRLGLLVFCILCIPFVMLRSFNEKANTTDYRPITPSSSIPDEEAYSQHDGLLPGSRRMTVVLSATKPSLGLCRAITSSMALGYPRPVVVSWHPDAGAGQQKEYAPESNRVLDVLEYLDHMTRKYAMLEEKLKDDDLVLVVDVDDMVFQLPPTTFLTRYHRVVEDRNRDLEALWSDEVAEMPMFETVIASSNNRCLWSPGTGSAPKCDDLQDSSEWEDTNEGQVGVDLHAQSSRTGDSKAKSLKAANMIGRVGDIRRYLRRVKQRINEDEANGGQKFNGSSVFGEIMQEQEAWRSWRRKLGDNANQNEGLSLLQRDFEYHLNLDLEQRLFLPNTTSKLDGGFFRLGNQDDIDKESEAIGISPSYLQGLPHDLMGISSPLSGINGSLVEWEEMPLYADLTSGVVPALISLRSQTQIIEPGSSSSWWEQMWYFPHLRELVTRRLQQPGLLPLAKLKVDGKSLVYWPLESEKRGKNPKLFSAGLQKELMPELDLTTLCGFKGVTHTSKNEWYDVIFGDGRGKLVIPPVPTAEPIGKEEGPQIDGLEG